MEIKFLISGFVLIIVALIVAIRSTGRIRRALQRELDAACSYDGRD